MTEDSKTPLITVTAAVIVKYDLILAAKRSGGSHLDGYFEFPGGKIEDGESPEECLRRELKEEFNVECSIGAFIGESIHHYKEKSIRLLGYYATHESGSFELHAHSQLKWLERKNLHKLKWAPADLPILELVQNPPPAEDDSSWYDRNSESYIEETAHFDVSALTDSFVSYLSGPKTPWGNNLDRSSLKILDVGCGSGRDSIYFQRMGFDVYATDASSEICKSASRSTGLKIRCIRAQDIEEIETYDGIWCCASLLHVPKEEISATLLKLTDALTNKGVLYMSFKYGKEERQDEQGRFFNDYDEDSIYKEIAALKGISIVSMFQAESPLRGKPQKWLNVFLKKAP